MKYIFYKWIPSILVCWACVSSVGCSRNGEAHQGKPSENKRTVKPVVITPSEGQVVVQKPGLAHVDPASGNLSWPAMTCTLPHCQGNQPGSEPNIFPFMIEGTTVDSDGKILWPPNEGPNPKKWTYCPICGQNEGVREYHPPEVVSRREELQKELAASRAAHKAARRQGEAPPPNHREPKEILQELSDLPRLFLVDDGRFNPSTN